MTIKDQESFLNKEYDQCFEHMRHYNNMTKDLLQFSYGYYSAIAALSIGVYQFFNKASADSVAALGYVAIILILCVALGTIITIQFVRYRKYYISTARQVNRIRKYYIESFDKFKSSLPIDPDIPKAYNPKSTQLLMIYMFIIINSIYLYIGLFCFIKYLHISGLISSYFAFLGLAVYVVVLRLKTSTVLRESE
jgi:hypothetical protein